MTTKILGDGKIATESVLAAIFCSGCGVLYALTESYIASRREDHRDWHCPNGCIQRYPGETKLERELRTTRERLEAEQGWSQRLSDSLESERRSHSATKGQLTKTRNRIQNGVCPECNRHFTNLERHMHSKHREQGG